MTNDVIPPLGSHAPAGFRVRLALSSPDIVARIRHAFADHGYEARLDVRHLVFEVDLSPLGTAAPVSAGLGVALSNLVHSPLTADVPRAPYRLALVGRSGRSSASAAPPQASSPAVSRGEALTLSVRETQVMERIARGMRNRDIAGDLGVTVKTVRNHINHIFAKLEVRDRVEAVLIW